MPQINVVKTHKNMKIPSKSLVNIPIRDQWEVGQCYFHPLRVNARISVMSYTKLFLKKKEIFMNKKMMKMSCFATANC